MKCDHTIQFAFVQSQFIYFDNLLTSCLHLGKSDMIGIQMNIEYTLAI